MRVKYLRLDNYANILAGMNKRSIEIDFSKCKNRVVLILGVNGSGKTAILSQIQPFPFTIGDARSGKSVLIKVKPENDTTQSSDKYEVVPAYKEIHYDVDGILYKIKHFIDRKGTVKSYISEDGKELNENGNVTSFREIVEAVLSITEDTVKLMRLGTNSSTFIKMNSTERKAFTSELLSEIDIYAKLYKKINDDFRILRGLIKNVSNKIDSLNIGDVAVARDRVKELEDSINVQNKNRDRLVANIGATRSKVERYSNMDLRELRDEMKELNSEIEELKFKINKTKDLSLKDVKKELAIAKDELQNKLLRINTLEANITSLRDRINDTNNNIDSLTSKLQMIQSSSEIGSLSTLLIRLDDEIKTLEKKFSGFNTSASLEDFKRLLAIYKDIEDKVSISHGFDNSALKKVIELYLNNDRPDRVLQDEFKELHAKSEKLKAEISAQKFKDKRSDASKYMIFKDSNCKCSCPFESFYDEIVSNDTGDKTEELESKFRSVQRKLDLIDDKFAISSNLNLIQMVVDANKSLVDRLPEGMLNFNVILDRMYKSEPVYDEEYITRYISFMEEYENLDALREKRREVKEEISKIRGNSETISFLNEELLKHKTSLENDKSTIKKMQDEIYLLEPDIQSLTSDVEHLEELTSVLENAVLTKSKLDNDINRVNEINNIIRVITEADSIISNLENEIRIVDQNILHLNNNKNNLLKRIESYDSLQEELKVLNDKFEKRNLIRDSLSSTKGIPLIYIKLYMMDLNTYINKLLRRVYGDSLEIGEFVITDKLFQIPYITNGITVPDASMMSQGEDSFVSLAFSFAFSRRSLDRYNVLCMDELDGPLDMEKRTKFIDILEEQMDAVGVEQAILISHNNVFDAYPVDAILTSPFNLDSYNNINVIHKVA